ncbi:hypothetical protein AB5J62_22630 [Amycolatopsis sp. cg5]|uniref:hypothetical protein n=1 Tax=Amycolatopsis sp. cg5 TaxID=3238802 RepID=UPI0035247778
MAEVVIRQVGPGASDPALVAARLCFELGVACHVTISPDLRHVRVRTAVGHPEAADTISMLLSEPRFHGWKLDTDAVCEDDQPI